MMQTLQPDASAKAGGWDFTIESPGGLRSALEEYTEYVMAAGAPADGGDPDPSKRDRAWRIWAQNQAIDTGMRDLLWTNRDAWRVINFYYRQGFWSEFRGWTVPARAVGIKVPVCLGAVRCQIPGDDRRDLKQCERGDRCHAMHEKFLEVLAGSIAALFAALQERCQRTLDNSQRTGVE